MNKLKPISAIAKKIDATAELKGKYIAKVENEKGKQTSSTNIEELRQLKQLLDDGIITQEDFDKKKSQMLGL